MESALMRSAPLADWPSDAGPRNPLPEAMANDRLRRLNETAGPVTPT